MTEKARPIPMPWSAQDVPHATLEVNQACNLACHGCYKWKFSYMKPLAKICEEVDIAARARKLETITLLGGEPTLHPAL
ncbi:MAG: 4Fe-4S cluster-binding domain-containing protein, partial [Myxococcota bacterium]